MYYISPSNAFQLLQNIYQTSEHYKVNSSTALLTLYFYFIHTCFQL